MAGLFITFEGIDGSGKTLQLKELEKRMLGVGRRVLFCREPGSTSISEKIREIILDRDNSEMSPVTEAYLYAASRAQLVHEHIKPSLEEGGIVICDRFVESSVVYQGIARGLGADVIMAINKLAVGGLTPDLTIIFDISPELALRRRLSASAPDRLESEELEFHKKVRDGYLTIAKSLGEIAMVVDASQSPDVIFDLISARIMKLSEIKLAPVHID